MMQNRPAHIPSNPLCLHSFPSQVRDDQQFESDMLASILDNMISLEFLARRRMVTQSLISYSKKVDVYAL